jgi:cbb3-type cytochrome oxidase maturation protein
MSVIFIILPLALVIVGVAVWGFVWSARSGQMDDLETPAMRMLHDEQRVAVQREPTSGSGQR